MVYTDGACLNNGKQNTQCSSGVWFDHRDPKNLAIKIPGENQSNQIGELAAIIVVANAVNPYQPLKIITDSKYVTEGLTNHLSSWEDDGWIGIKNTEMLKKAAQVLRHHAARMKLQWTKGHNRTIENKESDKLAKEGVNKQTTDILDLSVPAEFESQGAKLATIIQAKAYKGILEKRKVNPRRSTNRNLQLTCKAIHHLTGNLETDAAIWLSLRKRILRPIVQQFMYKTLHNIHMVGAYWENIENREDWGICNTCETMESIDHILARCKEDTTQLIWSMAQNLWLHRAPPWPEINLGIILGCGCISLQTKMRERTRDSLTRKTPLSGLSRFLRILLSESAYLT
jgi:ribonuclease HI